MTELNPTALSVVIPAYNEAESLPSLHAEIVAACEHGLDGTPLDFEIIIVDDGSTDDTTQVCAGLSPLRYIHLEHNSGQTAALNRGLHEARGQFVAALDGDGQNDPADIPGMLAYLKAHEELDCVCGWRVRRQDKLSRRIASQGAYLLRQLVLHDGVHDSGCTLKVFRRACLEGLELTSDQHRFIPALLIAHGYRVGEMPVNHRPRTHGTSKYGPGRMANGLRDLFAIRAFVRKGRA